MKIGKSLLYIRRGTRECRESGCETERRNLLYENSKLNYVMPAFLQRIFLKLKNKFMIQFMNTLNWYCNIQSLMITTMIMMIRRYMHGFSHTCFMSHALRSSRASLMIPVGWQHVSSVSNAAF